MTEPNEGDRTTWDQPLVFRFGDYVGNAITVTAPWDRDTGAVGDVTVTRHPECMYDTVFIGVGADGAPNSTVKQFTVPVGTTVVRRAQLAARDVSVVEDILSTQITAGAANYAKRRE